MNELIDYYSKLTRDNLAFIHFDITGFIRLGTSARAICEATNKVFNAIQSQGGNLLVPAYSYSYTDHQEFSIEHSPCTLGPAFDYLRKHNFMKRTYDGIFSYLDFSQNLSRDYFKPLRYAPFGENSVIAEAFRRNGLITTVGHRLHYSTEIHYLEMLLNVPYRFIKTFEGTLIEPSGQKHTQIIDYYCRDLEFFNKHNVTVSFEQLMQDLQDEKLITNKVINNDFIVQSIRLQDVLEFIKPKLKQNLLYLTAPV